MNGPTKNSLNFSFLIGTQRSGTTWLGAILGQLPSVAYWVEPRQVWSYGNYCRSDDVLLAKDCTAKIQHHIANRFTRFASVRNATSFIEKTPSNCLRVDFMRGAFPEAKFILIIRDGRAVLRSSEEIKSKGVDWSRIWARLTETNWREFGAYYEKLPWLYKKLCGQPLNFWGIRPSGWKNWAREFSPEQIVAKQWETATRMASDSFRNIPNHQKYIIKYEELVSEPKQHLPRLLEFATGTPPPYDVVNQAIEQTNSSSLHKWKQELSQQDLEHVEPILRPLCEELGYMW